MAHFQSGGKAEENKLGRVFSGDKEWEEKKKQDGEEQLRNILWAPGEKTLPARHKPSTDH